MKGQKGFTIAELMVAVMILLPLFALGLQTFIKCVELSDLAKNSATVMAGLKIKMTAIENTSYSQIYSTYNNKTFLITNMNGIGVSYVDNTSSNHLIVTISFSWKERSGRVIGEDQNLNGVLSSGEDLNGNGRLDSITEISTQIYDNPDGGPNV